MALGYPIGLLALAGLIIPVLIHLWNVKQGKTLKIGSVILLGENASSTTKSLKITDWVLFILRCLLLILMALVISQPLIKQTIYSSKSSGWILIPKTQLSKVYQKNKPTIDSLLKLGFKLRDFNLGFLPLHLKDSLNHSKAVNPLSYTALLNQLNKEIPSGYTAYIYADNKLVNFEGNLPEPSFNLIWKAIDDQDTLKTWSTKFLGKTYEAQSTPSLTTYSSNQSQNLHSISVMIYDPTSSDSKYIKAGLSAISDFTKRKIEVSNWDHLTSLSADFIFWLSDHPIDLKRLKKGAKLFTYQKGKVQTVNSTINLTQGINQGIELKKRVATDELKGELIWTDGFGLPILLKQEVNQMNHYYFYSRFDPSWTDLVWDEKFVKALMPIVLDEESTVNFGYEDNRADQRVLDQQQLLEAKVSKTSVATAVIHQNLNQIIWLLALLVLLAERILSFRKKLNHVKN